MERQRQLTRDIEVRSSEIQALFSTALVYFDKPVEERIMQWSYTELFLHLNEYDQLELEKLQRLPPSEADSVISAFMEGVVGKLDIRDDHMIAAEEVMRAMSREVRADIRASRASE